MALTDFLKKGAPTDADKMAEKEYQQNNNVETNDPVPETSKQEVPVESSTTPSNVSHRPGWMSDDDWKEATQYYSPERISQLYKGFDPKSVDPFYSTLYKSTIKTPDVPDEKRIKASNTIAGVTDALSLIVQGIAGTSGGYIPELKGSAIKQNSDYVQRLRDIYKADQDRYNAGLYQSTLRDIESARQGYDRDRSGLLGVIQNTRRLKNTKDISEAKNALEMQKWRSQEERLGEDSKERVRHNQAMEGIASRNAESNALRASKSGKSNSSTSTPRGYTDWYNPNTGYSYRFKENNIKAFVPQIFKEFEKDIFKSASTSEKMRYKALSPSERYNYVQAHWADSPSAVAMIEKIAESKEGNGIPATENDDAYEIPPAIEMLLEQSRPEYNGPLRPEEAKAKNKENGTKKIGW